MTLKKYIIEQKTNNKTFFARMSDHIEEDIERNWSSWNFGQDGFEGTKEELDQAIAQITDSNPLFISGFEIYPSDLKNSEFGELYKNYWVLKDNINARHGLSGIKLNARNIKDAIKEANRRTDYWGEGDSFDANDATLVYSKDNIHVFEV